MATICMVDFDEKVYEFFPQKASPITHYAICSGEQTDEGEEGEQFEDFDQFVDVALDYYGTSKCGTSMQQEQIESLLREIADLECKLKWKRRRGFLETYCVPIIAIVGYDAPITIGKLMYKFYAAKR